jgi:hypothetical protein
LLYAELNAVVDLFAGVYALLFPVKHETGACLLKTQNNAPRSLDSDGFIVVEDTAVEKRQVEGRRHLTGHLEASGEQKRLARTGTSIGGKRDGVVGMPQQQISEGLEVDPKVCCPDVLQEKDFDGNEACVNGNADFARYEVIAKVGLDCSRESEAPTFSIVVGG